MTISIDETTARRDATLPRSDNWTLIDVPEIETLPKAVFLRSQNLAAREAFPPHTHRWNQFVYATSGTLVVTVAGSWYVITPEQAIWVPTGVVHTTGALSGAAFRNLYVADVPGLGMPDQCTVYAVGGLLRALIVELERVSQQAEPDTYLAKLDDLIFEQLRRLPRQDFQHRRLGCPARHLRAHPGAAFREGSGHRPAGMAPSAAPVPGTGMAVCRPQRDGHRPRSGLCLHLGLHLHVPPGDGLPAVGVAHPLRPPAARVIHPRRPARREPRRQGCGKS